MTSNLRVLAVLSLLTPVALVGCSATQDPEAEPSSEVFTTVAEDAEGQDETEEETTEPEPAEDPDIERFALTKDIYAVKVPGYGACTIDLVADSMFCRVDDPEAFNFPSATSMHDPVVGFYPVPDGDPAPFEQAEELHRGEIVDIGGTILTHNDNGTIRVDRGPHWFALVDGQPVLGESPYSLPEPPISDGSAHMGEVCGQVTVGEDIRLNITALNDETACPAARDAVTAYIHDHRGEGEWTSADGWECSRDYAFPAEEVRPEDRFPTCTHPDDGAAAAVSMKWP